MEEPKDEEDPKLQEQKEVWTIENDSNGNEMNLSSEFNRNFSYIVALRISTSTFV